jgi:hypothetical protein
VSWHGVLEGFYGEPYADDARLALVDWLPTAGGRDFVYAPKDDPWQRARWREPYPAERMAHFAELLAAGERAGVRVGFVVSPGLDWAAGDEEALVAKLRAFHDLGARCLGVAFDDVPPGGAELGATHGAAVAAAVAGLPDDVTWATCPVDYATAHVTAYLRAFADALPDGVDVFWTGPGIVSAEVPTELARALSAELGRTLVLADNFPVSDGPMSGVLHLGPYPERPADLPAALGGLLLNLGPHPLASRLPAEAGLRWWADPARDRVDVWREALARTPALEPLARACRSWLTDPGPDPELAAWAAGALDGDPRLAEFFAAGCRAGLPADLEAELAPWLEAWELHALAAAYLQGALAEPGPGGAFTAAEVWRRLQAREQQLFGIRFAMYPLTVRDGDAERADLGGLVRGEPMLDALCREVLARVTEERS